MNLAWARSRVKWIPRVPFHLADYDSTSSTETTSLPRLFPFSSPDASPSICNWLYTSKSIAREQGRRPSPPVRLINSVRVIRKLNGSPANLNSGIHSNFRSGAQSTNFDDSVRTKNRRIANLRESSGWKYRGCSGEWNLHEIFQVTRTTKEFLSPGRGSFRSPVLVEAKRRGRAAETGITAWRDTRELFNRPARARWITINLRSSCVQ